MKTKSPKNKKTTASRTDKAVGSGPLVSTSEWTWNPPLEQQLEAKMSALFDIAELADQIKDPECFRRHARRIAKANGATMATVKINLG